MSFDKLYNRTNKANVDERKRRIGEQIDEDDTERFEEIMREIVQLTEEAYEITGSSGNRTVAERARLYWRGHIQGAVGESYSEYTGGSMYSMEDTLGELKD